MTEGSDAASYRAAGVDYDALDAAKRLLILGEETQHSLVVLRFRRRIAGS